MTQCTKFLVNRTDYRATKAVVLTLPELSQGEVLVKIDKFGLTANNVSYAVSGDAIGYWSYYPTAEAGWGNVPVWACATVVESKCSEVPVGDQLWGFLPMASHAVLQPGHIAKDQFIDIAEHRAQLPALYNGYRRTQAEEAFLSELSNERCLMFPLFATSYIIADYLIDNNFFGAEQVVIGSVSSKTGLGLAKMLFDNDKVTTKVVGMTSAGNVGFVEGLECCDQIVIYGNEASIDTSKPTAYVDMSGNAALTTTLHTQFGDNLVESCMVGASHWDKRGKISKLPGAKPTFFFAPGQFAKRDQEWGVGVAWANAMQASAKVAQSVKGDISIDWIHGADDLATAWAELLDNKVPPSRGLMVVLS